MDYILEIDNAVSKEFCEDAISRFENDKRTVIGETIGGTDENVKKSTDLPISMPSIRRDWQDVITEVGKCVNKALEVYQTHVETEGLDRGLSIHKTINCATIGLPQIQKTEKDGFYTWHHDGFLNRILTYILYLNDVEEGVGGTTEFLNRGHIQPKAGKLVIFPANLTYVHRGTKLKEGVKYLITNFIYEGPPIMKHPKDERLGRGTNGTSKMESVEEEIPKPENDEI
jgi:hypothetical protein